MKTCIPSRTLLLLVTLLLAGACRAEPPGWTPVLEETATAYLDDELARTLDRVSAARDQLRSDPARAVRTHAKTPSPVHRPVSILLSTVAPVFGIMAIGYAAARFRMLDEASVRGLVLAPDSVSPRLLRRLRARLRRRIPGGPSAGTHNGEGVHKGISFSTLGRPIRERLRPWRRDNAGSGER